MLKKIRINSDDNILIVAPHPDDECIGVGGILVNYSKQCSVIVCTDGRRSISKESPETLKSIRTTEFKEEMNYLGINQYFLFEIQDGALMQNINLFDKVDFGAFTKIFFPHSQDDHPDHTAAYNCVINKIKQSPNISAEFYMYEVHKQLSVVTHYIDITDSIEQKVKLIEFHKSQLMVNRYDEMVKEGARYRAIQLGATEKLIEVFCKVDVQDLISPQIKFDNYYLEMYQKQLEFYYVLTEWMKHVQKNKNVPDYLRSKGYKTIAIYGFAELGELLLNEFDNTEIDVLYVLDKRKKQSEKINIVYPQKDLVKVDAVIVTAIHYYDDIKREMIELGFDNIISLKDIVDELGKV